MRKCVKMYRTLRPLNPLVPAQSSHIVFNLQVTGVVFQGCYSSALFKDFATVTQYFFNATINEGENTVINHSDTADALTKSSVLAWLNHMCCSLSRRCSLGICSTQQSSARWTVSLAFSFFIQFVTYYYICCFCLTRFNSMSCILVKTRIPSSQVAHNGKVCFKCNRRPKCVALCPVAKRIPR